jgi:hypothetical protein
MAPQGPRFLRLRGGMTSSRVLVDARIDACAGLVRRTDASAAQTSSASLASWTSAVNATWIAWVGDAPGTNARARSVLTRVPAPAVHSDERISAHDLGCIAWPGLHHKILHKRILAVCAKHILAIAPPYRQSLGGRAAVKSLHAWIHVNPGAAAWSITTSLPSIPILKITHRNCVFTSGQMPTPHCEKAAS